MQLVLSRGSPQSPRLLSQPEGELKATSAVLGDSSWFLGRKEGRKEERCPIGGGDAEQRAGGPHPLGPSHAGSGQHVNRNLLPFSPRFSFSPTKSCNSFL